MNLFEFSARTIMGEEQPLAAYRGQVCLVVNVASQCGYTPQYAGLEALWRRHRDRRFAILGFPCDPCGTQEPGDDAEVQLFCSTHYAVTFPMFSKIQVNGPEAHPLFSWLRREQRGLLGTTTVKWNFTKFLVDRQGAVRARHGSMDTPEQIEPAIVRLLDEHLQPPPTGR